MDSKRADAMPGILVAGSFAGRTVGPGLRHFAAGRRPLLTFLAALLCAVPASMAATERPAAGKPAVAYSYPHPPDEPGWNGAFQDPHKTKLADGVAGGNARHGVIWAATTDERFVDVDLGGAVVLDRVVLHSYKHYTGRDFQLDHVRLYLTDAAGEETWKLLGEQRGYQRADEQGIREFVFPMPPQPVQRFRIGLRNDEAIRLGVSEIAVYSKDQPDISYALLAKFEKVMHAPEGPPPVATAEDREAGYVLFAPNYLRRVFLNSVPLAHERGESAAVAASPGEYEPFTVAIYPLQDLGRCLLRVTDLVGPDQAKIGSDRMEIRTVRHLRQIPGQKGSKFANQYMIIPELLEPAAAAEVKAGATQTWWITVHVPRDAPPGEYEGSILVEPAKGPAQRLRVRLQVLPIRLKVPENYQFGMYWGPWRSGEDAVSDEQIRAQLRDMREHGMNSVALSAPAALSRGESGEYTFDLEAVLHAFDLLQQEGFTLPVAWSHNFPPAGAEFGSVEHLAQVKAFVEQVRRELAARDLPEVLWYPRDEAWSDPRKQEARVLYEAVKQVAGARTYGTVRRDTAEYLDRWLDVRCHTVSLSGGFADQALREAAKAAGDRFWWYTNSCREYPEVMRFKAGFFFWKTGATGQFYWAYHDPRGNPYDDLDGIDWCVAYPGDGRPVPTVEWEALREGIDDFRYVSSLEIAIAEARAKGSAEAAPVVEESERLLNELRDDIVSDLDEYERRGLNFHTDSLWPMGKYDDWRRRIAERIVRLQSLTSTPKTSPAGR